MKDSISIYRVVVYVILLLSLAACDKDFLDAKPNKSLLVPKTLRDFQALLDYANNGMNATPYLCEVASDDFIISETSFLSYNETLRNSYLWNDKIYSSPTVLDWETPYKQIFYANVVLDGIKDFSLNNPEVRNLKGMALYYRAWALFQLSQTFTSPFKGVNADKELGLPIRTESDVTIISPRSNLKETYEQIHSDILNSIQLLEVKQETLTRPSKAAAYGFMARLQLILQDYQKAKTYADSTLLINNNLLDYNTLDSAKSYPLPTIYLTNIENPEVLFISVLIPNAYFLNNNTLVDTALYNLYDKSDLRKILFYTNNKQFRGSYMGNRTLQFSGLATDETYLIRSEALVRMGDIEGGKKDLNTLLSNRFKKEKFLPIDIIDSDELLKVILNERRKELLSRGIRWSDLKRLNQENKFEKVLYRKVNGKDYILEPDSKRYAFPIPDSEVVASGIPQNER